MKRLMPILIILIALFMWGEARGEGFSGSNRRISEEWLDIRPDFTFGEVISGPNITIVETPECKWQYKTEHEAHFRGKNPVPIETGEWEPFAVGVCPEGKGDVIYFRRCE